MYNEYGYYPSTQSFKYFSRKKNNNKKLTFIFIHLLFLMFTSDQAIIKI